MTPERARPAASPKLQGSGSAPKKRSVREGVPVILSQRIATSSATSKTKGADPFWQDPCPSAAQALTGKRTSTALPKILDRILGSNCASAVPLLPPLPLVAGTIGPPHLAELRAELIAEKPKATKEPLAPLAKGKAPTKVEQRQRRSLTGSHSPRPDRRIASAEAAMLRRPPPPTPPPSPVVRHRRRRSAAMAHRRRRRRRLCRPPS
mmetsp:Transcript_66269/g.214219  ORF Transcript_66269/g.214219 Transcript_66269/m.214219 type:complete len:207 (+) Transcript_66269:1417-2037(+)